MNNKYIVQTLFLIAVLTALCASFVVAGPLAPTITVLTPPVGANLTISNGTSTSVVVVVNVSVNSTTNISNVTLSFMNSANGSIVTVGSNTSFGINGNQTFNFTIADANISGRSDGIRNYTLRVEVVVADSNTSVGNLSANVSVVNISIDNTAPSVTLNGPANSTNQTSASVTFNFTVADNDYNFQNDTYNLTCTVYSGHTNTTSTSLNFRNANASVLVNASMSQKLHKWKAQCVDAFGIGANSSIRDVTFDSTPPFNANMTHVASVTYGSSIALACVSGDAVSNLTNATIYIHPAGLSGFRRLADNYTTNNVSFTFTETQELGTYEVNCTVVDYTGNQNSSTTSFEVVRAVSDQKTPLSVIKKANEEKKSSALVIARGGSSNLGELGAAEDIAAGTDAVLRFTVVGGDHSITVKDITADAVTITIQSTPQDVTINNGESMDIDVNDDGINDIRIAYNGMDSKKRANIAVEALEQPADGSQPSAPEPAPEPAPESGSSTMLIVIIAIIVVIIVGYFIMRRKQ